MKRNCIDCKYCKDGKLFPDDDTTLVCKKAKRYLTSHNLVELRPDWCPLEN